MYKLIMLAFIVLTAGCKNNENNENNKSNTSKNPDNPKYISYSIINNFPHDTSSFTQGLVIHNGIMYEGTGEYGHSKLLQVDFKTGKVERKLELGNKYFGEGVTILNDTIYQLTWKEKIVLVYSLKDFKKIKEFTINTDGWGITTDGKELIVSDGS